MPDLSKSVTQTHTTTSKLPSVITKCRPYKHPTTNHQPISQNRTHKQGGLPKKEIATNVDRFSSVFSLAFLAKV